MRTLKIVVLSVLVAAAAAASQAAEPMRVMTFNIRYGTAPDGDNIWSNRRDLVAKVIRDEDPSILGVQEALRSQLDELAQALPEYAKVGVGRDADGGGEYSAIFYRRDRFDLSDAGTFWLSATPEIPASRTWGNNLPRICTWARLHDRTCDKRILVFNTHWDHESQPARQQSARLMCERIDQLSREGSEPVIVTGDFNAAPSNPAIATLLAEVPLKDSLAVRHPDETELNTFNGFGRVPRSPKIDYVLINDHWDVEEASIIRTRDGQRFPSDHFPVTATLALIDDEEDRD